jgi:hypothetical protein
MLRFTLLTLTLLPMLGAVAQNMPTRVIRRGAAAGFELSDGEPISYFLEHARILELSDQQKGSLMEIRRRLRRTNAPFVDRLDSLRNHLGISLEPRRLTEEDLRQFARLEALSKPITDSMKVNNDAAGAEARALLDARQAARLDSLAVAERSAIRGQRPPRPPES